MRTFLLQLISIISSNSFTICPIGINRYRNIKSPTNIYSLKKIDDELSRLRSKTGSLLREKQRILKETTGMNFHNDSDIEAHLNRTFSKPFDEEDDDEQDDAQEDEQVRVIIMNGFNQRSGKNKNPFLQDEEDAK